MQPNTKGPNAPEKFKFNLDGQSFDWERPYVTGAELRAAGTIAPDFNIYLITPGKEDALITDEQRADLTTNGTEHFYSQKAEAVVIVVNGREKPWSEKFITFEQVVELAFGAYTPSPDTVYTVTYAKGPDGNKEGTMVKGEKVRVKPKMVFNVTSTNRS